MEGDGGSGKEIGSPHWQAFMNECLEATACRSQGWSVCLNEHQCVRVFVQERVKQTSRR